MLTKSLQLITLKGSELNKKEFNLGWLLKFNKLSRESSSLFVPTTTSFPLSTSRIGVKVAGNALTREEWISRLGCHVEVVSLGE